MSNIFFNSEPKIINPELACHIGLNEAIILQQIHYWLEKNKQTATNYHDGHYWTYGTLQEYRDRDFRFWSVDIVKRIFSKLQKQGFIIKGNYNKVKFDKTSWYTINYTALNEWIAANTINTTPIEQAEPPSSNSANTLLPTEQNCTTEQYTTAQPIQENKQQTTKQITNKNTLPPTPVVVSELSNNSLPPQPVAVEVIPSTELLFDHFWKLYPRKESKQAAKRAWSKLKPDHALFEIIINALEYRTQTKEWLNDNGRFIPHPATWLNGRRWEDEQQSQNICKPTALQQKYSDIRLDGIPLDPVQRKQLEYIESQLQNNFREVS